MAKLKFKYRMNSTILAYIPYFYVIYLALFYNQQQVYLLLSMYLSVFRNMQVSSTLKWSSGIFIPLYAITDLETEAPKPLLRSLRKLHSYILLGHKRGRKYVVRTILNLYGFGVTGWTLQRFSMIKINCTKFRIFTNIKF